MKMIAFACLVACAAVATAATPFEGTFKANGKDAKLSHVLAKKGDDFDGNPTITLVFSEKDGSKEAKPDLSAMFGELGDAFVVNVMNEKGTYDIIGSQLIHSALKHSGASVTGVFEIKEVSTANGELSGHILTKPNTTVFDEPLAIDLRFHVKQP